MTARAIDPPAKIFIQLLCRQSRVAEEDGLPRLLCFQVFYQAVEFVPAEQAGHHDETPLPVLGDLLLGESADRG